MSFLDEWGDLADNDSPLEKAWGRDAVRPLVVSSSITKSIRVFKSASPTAYADGTEHFALGVVLAPCGPDDPDAQGDYYTPETIRDAAYSWAEAGGVLGLQHQGVAGDKVTCLESWIQRTDAVIDGVEIKAGTWLMSLRVKDPELWQAVLSGGVTGLSIGGTGNRVGVS